MSVSRWYTRDVCCVRTGSRYILQFAESWYMIRVRACTIFLFVLAGLVVDQLLPNTALSAARATRFLFCSLSPTCSSR